MCRSYSYFRSDHVLKTAVFVLVHYLQRNRWIHFLEVTVTDKAERPYWRRSPLWDHQGEIRRRIAEGQSYAQIVRCLHLPITARRLGQFCCEQLSIHSLRPSRHDRARADKKSAGPAGPAAPTVPPAPAPTGASPSSSEAAAAARLRTLLGRPVR